MDPPTRNLNCVHEPKLYCTVVGDNINIMKTTFSLSFLLLTTFFQITSFNVTKEKLFYRIASLCLHVFFHAFKKLDIKIENRLHYVDIIAYHRI